MFLSELKNGDKFMVLKVILGKEIGKRLVDMGFTQGTQGKIVRSALLGDPVQINILSYNVSIRKNEAAGIEVELLPGEDNGK
jgi:Fe2+ transport system protein FeoA